jgi:methane monooxygenase component C
MTGSGEHAVKLTFEGCHPVELLCREDEDIVSAALRQGVLLLSDCREGTCGTCRTRLEGGEDYTFLERSPHALSEREEDEGWLLACRVQPRGTLHLDFDYPADRVGRFRAGTAAGYVSALARVAPQVVRIVVRTLEAQEPLRWAPGQYVRLRLAGVSRAYSLANLSGPARELELFVRLLPEGRFSQALAAMSGPGAAVTVEGPFGGFGLRDDPREPVFVAGGTGLAPILAMLRELEGRPVKTPATLVFGANRTCDLFALGEIERLKVTWPTLQVRLAVIDVADGWTGERGTAAEALDRHLRAAGAGPRAYYVCGGPGMIAAARGVLAGFAVPPGDIHVEPFVSTDSTERQPEP